MKGREGSGHLLYIYLYRSVSCKDCRSVPLQGDESATLKTSVIQRSTFLHFCNLLDYLNLNL